jgi:HAMP domain-containing protein
MELLVLVPLAALATAVGGAALAWRRLERGNRVSPSVRSHAPLHWRWSYHYGARLHRHLQRTVAAVRSCLQLGDHLDLGHVVGEIERHARAVDDQICIAARMPQPTRRRLMRELRAEIGEVDAMAERVIRLRRAWAGAEPSARTLAPVAERVEALESALRDLARLDRLSGLDGGVRHLDEPVERRRRPAIGN